MGLQVGEHLIVEIEPPKHGGMTLALSAGDQRFRDNFTYAIFPFLVPLIGALRVLHEGGYVDEKMRLLLGAPELEIRIFADMGAPDASLCVDLWPDHKRSKFGQPRPLFSLSASRPEIVSAFVTALRKLRDNISDEDFQRETRSLFPITEYDQLMASVE